MDAERQRMLMIAGAGGGVLALLYLISRRGDSGVSISADAAFGSALNRLAEQVAAQFGAEREETTKLIEELRVTSAAEFAEFKEAQASALAELETKQAGLLAPLTSGLATLTNQLNALVGRLTGVETAQQQTKTQVSALVGRLTGVETAQQQTKTQVSALQTGLEQVRSQLTSISGKSFVDQAQANLMAEDTRYQAALAAVVGRFSSDVGYYADAGRRQAVINSLVSLFGLSGQKARDFMSHAESTYKRLQRGELGSPGVQLPTLISGPMGYGVMRTDIPHNPPRQFGVAARYGFEH